MPVQVASPVGWDSSLALARWEVQRPWLAAEWEAVMLVGSVVALVLIAVASVVAQLLLDLRDMWTAAVLAVRRLLRPATAQQVRRVALGERPRRRFRRVALRPEA